LHDRDELARDLRGFEFARKDARKRVLDKPGTHALDARDGVHAERVSRAMKNPSRPAIPGGVRTSPRAVKKGA
jgi:hypothetical protein